MKGRRASRYGKEVTIIHPGEYYVSDDDEIIVTLLGSCVAVCLYDGVRRLSGMNHFMLPGRIRVDDIYRDKSAKYGITAISELIRSMESKGVKRSDLTAKIFGGGHVVENMLETSTFPEENIRLARMMMEIEDIPLVQADTGGNYTRKVLMDVRSGTVYLKKSTKAQLLERMAKNEIEYVKRLAPAASL